MFCIKCGEEIQVGQKFCVACGTPVAGSAPTDKTDEEVPERNASESGISVTAKSGVLPAIGVILLKIVAIVLKCAKVIVPLLLVFWIVSAILGLDMEKQSKKLLKETIQEQLLEEHGWDKYIALDKIEDFVAKEEPPRSGKWTGTANVTYKTKRGDKKSATIRYEFTVNRKGDKVGIECEAEDGVAAKLYVLLKSAGYFKD